MGVSNACVPQPKGLAEEKLSWSAAELDTLLARDKFGGEADARIEKALDGRAARDVLRAQSD
jgi:hypothetical protein